MGEELLDESDEEGVEFFFIGFDDTEDFFERVLYVADVFHMLLD